MNLTITERVTNGMAYLDATYPDHVDRVDMDYLDVGSGIRCPLAQAQGHSYENGISEAIVSGATCGEHERDWSDAHGFTWLASREYATEADALNAEWERQYRARKDV